MSSKKKVLISVSAFALVILAVIVAVVAILAAQQVTVKSNVNIYYTAKNITGSIEARYQVHEELNGFDPSGWTEIGSQSFTGAEQNTDEATSLNASTLDIPLTSKNKFVTFAFDFTNTNINNSYTATLVLPEKSPTTYNNFVEHYTNLSSGSITVSAADDKVITIAKNTQTEATYYVTFEIENTSANAVLNGDLQWNLVLDEVA